jgi:hypothetical protein
MTELIDRNLREWRVQSNRAIRTLNEEQADIAENARNSENEAA